MDTILSDAFTWKWTLKESGAQDLFSDDFRTFDTSFVNGYRFYFSNHLQASLFLLLCYYLSLLCWNWITFILVRKNGNTYFHYKRNIILCNSYKDEKKPIINKNTTMFFNEPEPKVKMSVCDQHIFVIHLSVYIFTYSTRSASEPSAQFQPNLLKWCSMSFLLKGCKCEIVKTCITHFWPKKVVLERNIFV